MRLSFCLALCLMLLAPASLAAEPKNYCESSADMATHIYVPPNSGWLYTSEPMDGNVTDDCDNNPATPVDFDGHAEWAVGGGQLATSANNAALCGFGGDHLVGPTISVNDDLHGPVPFYVMADWSLIPPVEGPDCGDNVIDACDPADPTEVPGFTCSPGDVRSDSPGSPMVIDFWPVIDGTYLVFVSEKTADGLPTTSGTITATGGGNGGGWRPVGAGKIDP